ncbi:pyruvate, phosphate dikinase [Nocardioides sp.]|uniref:pyruvate, phosphate dikinase n=1 Tax=Nocardioides sp. TaxID=35761 RepID=UPI00262AC9ED|nr:pyruvate, phosphate dikinase [Nocardioides sp.]MCW2736688.1 pyruvate phosphate dikinase PEP/pyruvate-binding [Nocardioides sp.]
MSATDLVHDVVGIDGRDVARFGGKAAGLARMAAMQLPVPPAFVIETSACVLRRDSGAVPPELVADVRDAMNLLEQRAGKSFAGGDGVPLLVSVRSGAQISMPGMMDTVLNLGLDVGGALRLAAACGDPGFVMDTWVRFWAMYADIVLDVDPEVLRRAVSGARDAAAASLTGQTAQAFEDSVVQHLRDEGCIAPTDPWDQLTATVEAVFDSWESRRAKTYRKHHGISDDLGTAVTVQAMVFGNLGTPSGSGVAFTRDPATGHPQLYGEYLSGGQGEEVVAGTHTPTHLSAAEGEWVPLVEQLTALGARLELEYRDALDIEFTVEEGVLYLLQVRPAKRTAQAALTIAAQLVEDGEISVEDAIQRVSIDQVASLVTPRFDQAEVDAARARGDVLTTGIAASPGHAAGMLVVDPDRAADLEAEGLAVVLVRPTTSPQDLHGMIAAQAVVTQRGGATSHAAVVSRALDKACVVGCEDIEVDLGSRTVTIGTEVFEEGVALSVDGATGEIFRGALPLGRGRDEALALETVLSWADLASRADVWRTGSDALGGNGPVTLGLVDVLAWTGRLEPFVAAVDTWVLEPSPDGAASGDVIEAETRKACADLFAQHQLPLQLRMPSLSTARARRLLDHWTALAPEQLEPLGWTGLLERCLAGVAGAVADAGRTDVAVLLAGVTTPEDLERFAELVGEQSTVEVGAVLQNAAAVFDITGFAASGRALWIDLPALIRSVEGRTDDLLLAPTPEGDRPDRGLSSWPLVAWLLDALPVVDGPPLGVVLPASGGALATDLHSLGVRRFASSSVHAEQLRLLLAQHTHQRRSEEKDNG